MPTEPMSVSDRHDGSVSVLHQVGSSTIDGASYGLDNAGNRTSKTDWLASVTSTFTYDAIYELTQVTQGNNTTETYSYDPVHNRLSSLGVASYSNNNSNELTSTSNATYTYDNNGNTLTKTDSTGTTTYAWDFENRLTSATLPGSGGTVSFKYDPSGKRIFKSSSSGTSVFAYDGNNLIEETNAAGTVVARYEEGTHIDDPLAVLRSGATSYYETDGLSSVTSLSSATGALAQTYTYDSFAKLTASSGSVTNSFRYTGREFDTETNLYYNRARYYDPATGRFLNQDPIRFSGGVNFYAYTRNNPANYADPLGLCPSSDNQNDTPNCIASGLQTLFPEDTVTVGDATQEVGGHWNFNFQLQFPSNEAADAFNNSYQTNTRTGWGPPARFGGSPALHLENVVWSWDDGSGYSVSGTAHIDLYNPDTGLGGLLGHAFVDGVWGHVVNAFGQNIVVPSRFL